MLGISMTTLKSMYQFLWDQKKSKIAKDNAELANLKSNSSNDTSKYSNVVADSSSEDQESSTVTISDKAKKMISYGENRLAEQNSQKREQALKAISERWGDKFNLDNIAQNTKASNACAEIKKISE